MWIFLKKSFLSIVKNRNDEEELLEKLRVNGDIEKVFQKVWIFNDLKADYGYRLYI